ncbi:MAG: radical SAM protein [Opitutaceae bacterium]|nr:radical SAM protein [Opitutaceae bacterium]
MKILLILPAGERVRVTPDRPDVPRRAMLRFSVLPLTVVAALTPPAHDVRIIDENVEPLDFAAECDVVGITFMTALAPRAYEIARRFRSRGKIVIAGGYHATLCPEETAAYFDSVVIGDAEDAWSRLLADLAARRLQKFYRPGGGCGSERRLAPPSRYQTPVPRRDLLARTARHYVTVNAVQTGRGCGHGCRYCSITAFHRHTYKRRSVEAVLAELRTLPRDFIFVDDNIIADRAYIRELCLAMIPLRKRWVSQCSLEVADDPALLRLLHAAGCRGLFIGIETVSAENLATMGKQFNDCTSYHERIRRIHAAGIGIVAGIILGLDHDAPEVFERTLRFLQQAQIGAVQVNILTPLPGTPLFDDMQRAGRMTDRDWSHYDFRHVVFRPAGMTATELQAGADWLYAQFYRLDRILWRALRGLLTAGWLPALLGLKLGLTYRYDNRREGISGWNPARSRRPVVAGSVLLLAACLGLPRPD